MDYSEQSRQNRFRRLEILRLNKGRLHSVPIQYIGSNKENELRIYVNRARNNQTARLRRHGSSVPNSSYTNARDSGDALTTQCEDNVESLEPPLPSRSSESSRTTYSDINVHSGNNMRVHSTVGGDGELHTSSKFQVEESEQSVYVNQVRNSRIARLKTIRSGRLRRHGSSVLGSSYMNVINSANALTTQCEDSVKSLEPQLSSRSSQSRSITSSYTSVHTGNHVGVHSTTVGDGELHASRKFQDRITSEYKIESQNAFMPAERIEMVENATKSTDSQSSYALPVVCSVKPESTAIVEGNLLDVWPSRVKSFPNSPTLEPTWCGSFEIPDSVSRGEFFDGFLAHPPVNVQIWRMLLCTFSLAILRVLRNSILTYWVTWRRKIWY